MLDIPSSSLNGRLETTLYAQDVALAVARKVADVQRQVILELRTPTPDRKPDGTITDDRRNTPKDADKDKQ